MNTKYELLLNDTVESCGTILYRIKSLNNIYKRGSMAQVIVKYGELGGYIENESCLDTEDKSWIGENVWVAGKSRVTGNSMITSNPNRTLIIDDSKIYDSEIKNGHELMIDACVIKDSYIENISRYETCRNSEITNTEVYDSSVYRCSVDKSTLSRSNVTETQITDSILNETHTFCVFDRGIFPIRIHRSELKEVSIKAGSENTISIGHKFLSNVRITRDFKNIMYSSIPGSLEGITAFIDAETDEILYNVKCQSDINEERLKERIFEYNGGIEENPHRVNYLAFIEASKIFLNYKYEDKQ